MHTQTVKRTRHVDGHIKYKIMEGVVCQYVVDKDFWRVLVREMRYPAVRVDVEEEQPHNYPHSPFHHDSRFTLNECNMHA